MRCRLEVIYVVWVSPKTEDVIRGEENSYLVSTSNLFQCYSSDRETFEPYHNLDSVPAVWLLKISNRNPYIKYFFGPEHRAPYIQWPMALSLYPNSTERLSTKRLEN